MYSLSYWIFLLIFLAIVAFGLTFLSHKSFLESFFWVCVGSALYHIFRLVIPLFKK